MKFFHPIASALLLLGALTGPCSTTARAASPVYTTDFESGAGSEWSITTTDNTIPATFTRFLGRLNNQSDVLTVSGLTAGQSYTVVFDLFLIDSWDGGSIGSGDSFRVLVDGTPVLNHTYSQFGGTQTWPLTPDSKGQLGFSGWEDAIFRTVEVTFVAAGTSAAITFQTATDENLANESCGIDNVSVWLSADLPASSVVNTSLPAEGTTTAVAIDRFSFTGLRPFTLTTATNAANYQLRHAGVNGNFGDSDDTVYAVTASYSAGTKVVNLVTTPNPLQPGKWRFQTLAGLQDQGGQGVTPFTRIFTIAAPTLGNIENDDNGTLPVATPLTMTETPAGATLFTGYGIGTFATLGDVDYWRFDAEAGDRITVDLEATDRVGVYPILYLRNAADGNLRTVQGGYSDGNARFENFVISSPGTYYLRVWSDNAISTYRFRIDQSRGIALETEPNDSQGAATVLGLSLNSGVLSGRAAGALDSGDTAGDFYRVGNLSAGNSINVTLTLPDGSSVAAGDLTIAIEHDGGGAADASGAGPTLNHVATANAVHYVRITTPNLNLRAQYVVAVAITDAVPPTVTSVDLPAEGTTSTAIIDRLSAVFSDEMTPGDINTPANFELRGSVDNTFGNLDDTLYTVTSGTYSNGLTANFTLPDGPLQPGNYRFTMSTSVRDRAGNNLATPYVRLFTVAAVAGFVVEDRGNDTPAGATPLGPQSGADGSFSFAGHYVVGNSPYDVAKGDFDGDGSLDLALANYSSSTISVLLGHGDGSFVAPTNFPTHTNPVGIAAGDVNDDGKLDLVTANYGANTISILTNNGDGTFAAPINVAVGSNPRNVRLAHLDLDAFPEILVANGGSAFLTVLHRDAGTSTYTRTDYPTGSGTWGVAVGDVDGDTKLDVVACNANVDSVSVLLGNGTGGLAAAVNYPVGDYPRDVAIGDLDGDGKADLVTVNANSRNLSVLKGDGTGTFPAAVAYGGIGSDPYHLALVDVDASGKPDVVVAVYGSSYIDTFVNNGDGTFGPLRRSSVSYNPIGVVAGDWNGDGRMDLATAGYGGDRASVWLGNAVTALGESPTGVFTGLGRGRLSSNADYDYYSFTAQAGDVLNLAVEVPGSPGSSQLYYRLDRADGAYIYDAYTDGSGRGQSDPITLTQGGTYTVYVRYSNNYFEEYRVRATLIRGVAQLEYENGNNNSIAGADVPALSLVSGKQVATVAGYLGVADTSGDYYGLGNLTEGTAITLTLRLPASSGLAAILGVYKSDGTLVGESDPGASTFSYAVPVAGSASYFVRIRASSGAGLLAQYLMDIELADTLPPSITSLSFPAEGTTTNGILDRFTLGFSEDMMASTVTNAANYELRSSQNITFGDDDDSVYSIAPAAYSTGLSATFIVADAPLQPGKYRLTVGTGLQDRVGLPLSSAYVRTFTVEGVGGYILEDRSNDTPWTATPLGPRAGADGSFAFVAHYGVDGSPYDVAKGDFNGDGKPDLALANYGSSTVSVLFGNGDGTFQAAVAYPTHSNPIGVAAGDLNNDGKTDLVTANYGANTVSALTNNGDGTFSAPLNIAVGSNPRNLRLGELNGDAYPEIIVANGNSSFLTVLHREPGDATYARTDYPTGSATWAVALGDVDNDTRLDVVACNANADNVSVLLGDGGGGLGTATNYAVGDYPRDVAIGDLDGDGKADIVTVNANSRTLSVLKGNGDATFPAPVTYGGIGSDPYHLTVADLNADGKLDVAVAVSGSSYFELFFNNGDGTYAPLQRYSVSYNPIGVVAGDWNADGQTDLAFASYGGDRASVWVGNPVTSLAEDPANVLTSLARGNVSSTSDYDYYSFTARAGDILGIAIEVPGSPGSAQLYYRIDRPDGAYVWDAYTDGNGRGQSDPITIGSTGTYTVFVRYSSSYFQEYRLRVTLVRGGIQMEYENGNNNSIAAADFPSLTLSAGKQSATIHGYIGVSDGNGDYYGLGNLTEGTAINLGLRKPAGSPLVGILGIYKADGTLVVESAPGDAALAHTVASGANGGYYARVRAGSGSGFLAQYLLDIELTDTLPPTITSVDLPAEGSTSKAIVDRFVVGFSEDMMPSTVTNAANYVLVSSQNNDFGDGDDSSYAVLSSGYASGTNATFLVSDGPLQPGKYRLTIGTGLADRAGVSLVDPYTRNFTVEGVPGFVLEDRNNNSQTNATPLGPKTGADGSFWLGAYYGVGNSPYDIAVGDLNGDGKVDAVLPNINSDNVSVLLGNGDGTFQSVSNFPAHNGPIGVAIGDLNNDAKQDVVVVNYYANTASILLGDGTGALSAPVNVAVGTNPRNVRIADLDGDNFPEILVANGGSPFLSVLRRTPAVATYARTDKGTGTGTWGVAVRDVSGDGKLDVVTANADSDNVSVLLGDGAGGLATAVNYPVGDAPRDVAIGDLDGDGFMDIVALNAGARTLGVLEGDGTGTFPAPVTYAGIGSDPYHLTLADLNADGRLDVVVAVYGNSYLDVFMNRGDGTFGDLGRYSVSYNPIGVTTADVNGDGTRDLLVALYGGDRLGVWLGNPVTGLVEDPSGLFTATARGNTSGSGDTDYYSFSGKAGDRLSIAVEVPGYPGSSQLYYRVDRPDGAAVTGFYSNGSGYGQSDPVTLPMDGTYTVYAQYYSGYTGEYRLRVTLARGGMQIESENNNAFGQANVVALTLTGGQRKGSVMGYINAGEPSTGDFFSLGNLTEGNTIDLALRAPTAGSLGGFLRLYDPSQAQVAATTNAGSGLSHTVASGANGTYYARVLPNPPRREGTRSNLTFSGSTHVDIPIDVPESAMTVSFWFYSLNSSAGLFQVARGPLGNNGNDRHVYLSGGNIHARLYSNQTIGSTGMNYADGRWHHVAYQFGAAISGQRLYVDGVLVASGNKASSDFGTQDRINLGYSADLGYMFGSIEDVSVWDSVLPLSAIQALITTPPTGAESGLLGYWRLNEGSGTTLTDLGGQGHPGTLVNGTPWYVFGAPTTQMYGLLAQYVLDVAVVDNIPPQITSVSLPSAGSTSSSVIDRFTIEFSEDMLASAVLDAASYDLRSAGPNGSLGDDDDLVYTVSCNGYTTGLSASYQVVNGPLQAGLCQLTIKTALQDRAANALAAPYIRQFTLQPPAGFVLEDRANDSFAAGTSLSPTLGAAFDGSFFAGANTTVGSNPHDVKTAELDGDGNLDLVVTDFNSANIAVLLGNGDGTFKTPVYYATASGPIDLVVADLNGDGKLDVATANYNAHNVSVLLGAGDGTFGTATTLASANNPNGIVSVDFNKDGKPDLAVARRNGSGIHVYLGHGDGTFDAGVHYPTASGSARLASADLDGDGNPDLAVVNYNSANVSILLGDGGGGFGTATNFATGNGPYWVAIADLGGDGRPDLVVANEQSASFSVLLGTGGGEFATKVDTGAGANNPHQLKLVDLDGDGRLDLVVANYRNNLAVFYGLGGGAFRSPMTYGSSGGPLSTAVGDYNEDGRPDLATAYYDSNVIGTLFGNGTRELTLETAGHGIRTATGYGNLSDGSDVDYWLFSATAGDTVVLGADVPGRPGGSGLRYRLMGPNGSTLADFYAQSAGWGQSGIATIPVSGTYAVLVTQNYSYTGEYRIRVITAPEGVSQEGEANDGVGSASALALATSGSTKTGTAVGYIRTSGDLDYFNLGTVDAGMTVFLNARMLDYATLAPVVSVYNASNGYVNEAPGGRAFDAVAEVRITTPGTYYAVVRGGPAQGGLREGYVLETQIVPTASVAFPNLQVTSLLPPSGTGLRSGDPVQVSFTVKNVGALATPTANWTDRLVLSPDTILGDLNDITLAVFPHSGVLDTLGEYTVNQTVNLPDGIEGDFYLLAQTDSGNAIAEFVLEADNITISDNTLAVTRADYPDLRPEGIAGAVGPSGVTLTWSTANRGAGASPAGGFKDSVTIRNVQSGAVAYTTERNVGSSLAPNATLAGEVSAPLPGPGHFAVEVVTDSALAVYEYDGVSHASAEDNNLGTAFFDVISDLQVANLTVDPAGDLVSGGTYKVKWDDRLTGDQGSSGSWVDRVVVVNRTTGATILNATVAHDSGALGNLEPGQSHARERVFTLPAASAGAGTIEITVTVDSAANVTEYNGDGTGDSNNTAQITRTSGFAPYPDLVVVGFELPPNVDAGQSAEVRWLVANRGTVDASGSWTDQLYLSSDPTGTGPVSLGTFPFSGTIVAGTTNTRTGVVTIPASAIGDRYLVATADVGANLAENNDANNSAVSATPMLVRRANLRVKSLTVPPAGNAGQPVTVNWEIENVGNGAAFVDWDDGFYVSLASDGSNPVFLGQIKHQGILAAGESVALSGTVTLPGGVPGNRYIVLETDVNEAVPESDDNDNTRVAGSALVLGAADLTVAAATAPGTGGFGTTITINYTLQNVGNTPAGGVWSDKILLSTDNLTGGDTLLFARPIGDASPVSGGASVPLTAEVTLPVNGAPGTYYLFVQADGNDDVDEANEGNNFSTPIPISLTIPPRPDLVVENIQGPVSAQPGGTASITWSVRNAGAVPVTGTWRDSVYLSSDALVGADLHLGTFGFTDTLANGASTSRTREITIPGTAPSGNLYLVVVTDTAADIPESSEANNGGVGASTMNVPLVLTLSPNTGEVKEGNNLPLTLTRSGDRTSALTVNLGSSDATELTAPSSVVIPAGQASVAFNAHAENDGLVDGNQSAVLTASVGGFSSATGTFQVTDAQIPQFVVRPSGATATVTEGSTLGLVVEIPFVRATDVQVTLSTSSSGQLVPPAPVVIPAGQTSAAFLVMAADDTLVEGTKVYKVSASAAGIDTGTLDVTVADNDVPVVTLSLMTDTISEGAGAAATTGTLLRSIVSDRELVVRLASNSPDLTLPAQVVIPANQGSATFGIGISNNVSFDGTRTMEIQGTVLASSGSEIGTTAPVTLTVTDDDGPTLKVTFNRGLVGEGLSPAAVGTVSRNTATIDALVVTLVSSETDELSVPAQVTIPIGAASVTFDAASLSDGVTDGNQVVTVTAVADGFTSGAAQITVTDFDIPDLVVTKSEGPATADTEAYISATYRIVNQGNRPAGTNFTTRVYLSTDPVVGDDTLAGNYVFKGTIPAGLYFEQSVSIRMPTTPGKYWVITATDVGSQIVETLEDNNVMISVEPITVQPAYTAIVATPIESAVAGSDVPMSGLAVKSNGQPAPEGSMVNIHIYVNGTHRVISALTDRTGKFETTWHPLFTEAGAYDIGAAHPGQKDAAVQDHFVLLGMKIDPPLTVFHVAEGASHTGSLRVINLSPQPLTGLQVLILGQPSNVSIDVSLGSTTLPGNGETTLNYTVTANDISFLAGSALFYVSSVEGSWAGSYLGIAIDPLRPHLAVNQSPLTASVLRGATRIVSCTVTNDGGFPSDALTVSVPPVGWIRVASQNPIPSLAPGETAEVTLVLTPPADLPLGPYNGNVNIGNSLTWINVPFNFRAVSEAKGDLKIVGVDEFTYYAEGSPKVADANVVVRDPYNYQVVAQGKTDAEGVFLAPNLAEGFYDIELTAPKHTTYRNTFFVNAGTVNELLAFTSRETVRYTWTVVPIEIEDHYKITIETTFETVVPVPVITVEPAVIDLGTITAAETQIDLKITNHGLIQAEEFQLHFPTHPSWEFTPLVSDLGFLAAKSTIIVPLTIKKLTGGPALAGKAGLHAGGACHTAASATWSIQCGPFSPGYSTTISMPNAGSGCGGSGGGGGSYPVAVGGGFGGGGGRGGGGSGGGGGFSGPSVSAGAPCSPPAPSANAVASSSKLQSETRLMGSDGVCARVKVRLEQEAVITRDAFQATLEVENDDTTDLTEVAVSIKAQDANGRDVSDLFGIHPPTLTGIAAVDGTGVVPKGGTSSARWLIVPTVDAAPTEPVVFFVSGEFSYVLGDTRVNVPLEPVRITVLPTPRLWMKYFHQRDVYSDDPFTDEIEPSIPYSLAVMVENRGYGSTKSMKITSAQPQIVENEKGLLIDFKIIGTRVAGQNMTPSLTVDLGDIGPGESVIGEWYLTSTLQGLFIDYKASFEHVDGLGNPRLSLIEDLSIHEMIHEVYAEGPFEDFKPDFFVNQVPDELDLGDTIYLSNGQTNPVERVDFATVTGSLPGTDRTVVVTASVPSAWVYLRIPDPGNGQYRLERVVRSDGQEIRFGVNVWATDRTFIGQSKRPIRENIVHLLDYASTGSYTFYYEGAPPPDSVAPTSKVNPMPATSSATFPVTWAGQDNVGGKGVAYYDVFVAVDGGTPVLWLGRTDVAGSMYAGEQGRTYSFFSRATDLDGNREAAPGIADATTQVGFASSAPVLGPIAAQTTAEDTPIAGVSLAVSDPDTASADLTFQVESSNLTLVPVENVVVSRVGDAFTLGITPVADRSGTADITLTVRDGSDSAQQAFTVTVTPVNDSPVAVLDSLKRRAGGSAKILISQMLANDTDPESDPVTFIDVTATSVDGGTVRRSGDWILYTPPTGGGDSFDWFNYSITDGRGGVAVGAVLLTTDETDSGQSQNILDIHLEGDAVVIQFTGIPGRTYLVQASPSLLSPSWVTIGTVVADRVGVIRFVEEHPAGGTRYYRTLETGN